MRGGEKGLWRPPRPTIHPPFPAPFPTPPDPPTQNIGINRVGIDSELSRAWLVSSRWTGCLFCTNQCQLPSTILDPTIVNCLVSHIAHRTSHIVHRTSYIVLWNTKYSWEMQNIVEKYSSEIKLRNTVPINVNSPQPSSILPLSTVVFRTTAVPWEIQYTVEKYSTNQWQPPFPPPPCLLNSV